MTHILLLGAGFSRNWGGLLATEVFDQLIGVPEINKDEYLKKLLWDNKNNGGFENALAEVQNAFIKEPSNYATRLQHIQGAISDVFNRMNHVFFEIPIMEFQPHQDRMLRTFLFRFDAIFTLNQDIFLEHHYFRHIGLSTVKNWTGAQLPGMRRIPNQEYVHDASWGKDTWIPLDPAQFQIENQCQPFFKLHGSSNWIDSQGGQLLVIGGDKSRNIQSHEVLAWYFDKFREYLTKPDAKLFVIGYGFKDSHINEAIIDAVENSGLQFFVIDRWGSDVVRHANPSFGGDIYAPNALDDAFIKGLIGASERSLADTFGDDSVSHTNVMQYFN